MLKAYSLVGRLARRDGALGTSIARVGSIRDGNIIGVGSISPLHWRRSGEQRKEESSDFGVHGCKKKFIQVNGGGEL